MGHLPYGLITVEGSRPPYELNKPNYISRIYLVEKNTEYKTPDSKDTVTLDLIVHHHALPL